MVRKQGQSHERYIWCANIDSLMRYGYDALTATVSREIVMVHLQGQSHERYIWCVNGDILTRGTVDMVL
jgi:hypothetical protein